MKENAKSEKEGEEGDGSRKETALFPPQEALFNGSTLADGRRITRDGIGQVFIVEALAAECLRTPPPK